MLPYTQQDTLSFPTDTATPVTPIPIFYLHAGEHPFCLNSACICHVNEARLGELLHGILDRSLRLRGVQGCAVHHLDSEGGSQ